MGANDGSAPETKRALFKRRQAHREPHALSREPAEIELTVGMLIGAGDRTSTPRDPAAVADALAAWRDEGVQHLICWAEPTDAAGVDAVTEGVRRFRDS